ncbi:MAG: enoyl-CoA hydratase, partial [Acidimicrobiia bacterium]|nr:enoyl-CoA hydratase [Acidimicrobiia bacterium]
TRFLQLGLHPGGGHTWMMSNLLGPQAAAATVVFGDALDGEAAERKGLAWRCFDDDSLIESALAFAAKAAGAPRLLARRVKQTLRQVGTVTSLDEAVSVELEAQLWSMQQPDFAERLEARRRR